MTETDRICFEVPGPPITQGSMRRARGGRMYHVNAQELEAWRQRILAASVPAALRAGWILPLDEPVEVWVQFRLERPGSVPKRKYPHTRPDLDKLQRSAGDALSPKRGIKLLREDARIIGWYARKDYGTPGVSVMITRRAGLRPETATWLDLETPF